MLNRPQGHSADGRIMSMKISSESTRNRNRVPDCSAVVQPTVPPRQIIRHLDKIRKHLKYRVEAISSKEMSKKSDSKKEILLRKILETTKRFSPVLHVTVIKL
jgi:hypothetical protein